MLTRFEAPLIRVPGDVLPRPHGNCYWVVRGRVLAGEYPAVHNPQLTEQRLRALVAAGVTHCFNFTHADEALPDYGAALAHAAAERGAQARTERFAVADFGVPSVGGMRRTLQAIDTALAQGANVYLHCRAGIGRTGTVVGCLLVEQGFSADESLALIRDKWQVMDKRRLAPHSPETDEQREFIERWAHGAAP